jgi:hypothetical protein
MDRWNPMLHRPILDDLYFIWEHTNFTCPEAIDYNTKSLDFKESYLENKYGKLKQVWKSSRFLPGDSYPVFHFTKLLPTGRG